MTVTSRLKSFTFGSASSILAQISSLIVGVISVYLGMRYFGPLVFGMWLLIKSILRFSETSEFGMSGVTTSLVAKYQALSEQKAVILKTGLFLFIISIVALIVLACTLLTPRIWLGLLGAIPENLTYTAIYTVIILVSFQLARLPTVTFISAFGGLQHIATQRFYVSILLLWLNLGALLLTIWLKKGLLTLALLTGISNILPGIIASIHFFIAFPQYRINFREKISRTPSMKLLSHSGFKFLVMGISSLIVMDTDNIIISHFLGPGQVASFAITYKFYMIAFSAMTIFSLPIWPIYSKAAGQHNWAWINEIYNLSNSLLFTIGGLICIGAILFAKLIILWWVGPAGFAGNNVVLLIGLYAYVFAITNNSSVLLGAINEIGTLIWIYLTEAGINLFLSIILIQRFGLEGVSLATVVAAACVTYWLLPKDVAKKTHDKVKSNQIDILKHLILVFIPCLILTELIPDKNSILLFAGKIGLIILYLIGSWLVLSTHNKALCITLAKRFLPLIK